MLKSPTIASYARKEVYGRGLYMCAVHSSVSSDISRASFAVLSNGGAAIIDFADVFVRSAAMAVGLRRAESKMT